MDGWADGWVDGWMNGKMKKKLDLMSILLTLQYNASPKRGQHISVTQPALLLAGSDLQAWGSCHAKV